MNNVGAFAEKSFDVHFGVIRDRIEPSSKSSHVRFGPKATQILLCRKTALNLMWQTVDQIRKLR